MPESFSWGKPAKDLDDALDMIAKNCQTLQLEHRLDPYSHGVVNFERAAGDKLSNPFLGDSGVEKICSALEKNKSCKALDLSGNKLGEGGVEALCKMLKENDCIEILYLEDNAITDDACAELAALLTKNKTLKQLNLSGNKISSKGAKVLAQSIRKNEALEALWLNRNQIRDGGAKEFGECLKKNDVLDTLCLEDNKIRERGAKVLAKALRKNTDIETLNLGGNKIGSKGAKYFGKALKKNEKHGGQLKKLVLGGNRFNEHDMETLEGEASSRGVTLMGNNHYDVYGNDIEHLRKENGLKRMRNYLKYHTKPKYLRQGHFNSDKKVSQHL